MGAQASLEIHSMVVVATSGLAFRIDAGARLSTSLVQLQATGSATSPISCAQLGMAMSMHGLICDQLSADESGTVSIGGPIFISTSGIGFGMSPKYMGDDINAFKIAVYTAEEGLYALQMTDDSTPSPVALAIGSAMRVSITGDESLPAWVFTGTGSAFSVALYGHLSLRYVTLSSDGSSLPLTVETGGSATVMGVVFRSSVGDITAVSVADGGSLTVGESQLVGGVSYPFPCDGTLPDCATTHAGLVTVEGPSAIHTTGPLVCDVDTGECLVDLCFEGRCKHGGICSEMSCHCVDGWRGEECTEAPDPMDCKATYLCGSNYCQQHCGRNSCCGGHVTCDPNGNSKRCGGACPHC